VEWLFDQLFKNPIQAALIVVILAACWLARELFKKFKDEVFELKKTAGDSNRQMFQHQQVTAAQFDTHKKMLEAHKDDMGKFTKAVSGELLKTSEKLLELKQEMLRELLNLKAMSTDTERNMTLANEVSKLAIQNLNEKLGRVILIEKTLDAYGAQISKLQEGVGKTAIDLNKHQQWFGSIGEALKAHKTQLQKLESDFKRDKKG
jgi:hypothetical protein